jgi:quercetin dioxygenase-like cupin family protein
MTRQALTVAIGLLLFAAVAAIGFGPVDARQDTTATATSAAGEATAAPPIVRDLLGSGSPETAPGQTLGLYRFTIAPGATLPVHVHPGMQIAWIETGELTYHVLKGEVPVGRADAGDGGSPTETLAAGETTVLRPGDWVIETPGAVHFAENPGDEPIVIWGATLFAADAPPAISVNPEGTPVG